MVVINKAAPGKHELQTFSNSDLIFINAGMDVPPDAVHIESLDASTCPACTETYIGRHRRD